MNGSHAVAILTEWEEFRDYDYDKVFATMPKPACIFDGQWKCVPYYWVVLDYPT